MKTKDLQGESGVGNSAVATWDEYGATFQWECWLTDLALPHPSDKAQRPIKTDLQAISGHLAEGLNKNMGVPREAGGGTPLAGVKK